jgi:hypothetical protein
MPTAAAAAAALALREMPMMFVSSARFVITLATLRGLASLLGTQIQGDNHLSRREKRSPSNGADYWIG